MAERFSGRHFRAGTTALLGGFVMTLAFGACEAEYPEPRFGKLRAKAEERAPEAQKPAAPPANLPDRPRRGSRVPGEPDPMQGVFKLDQALAGLPGRGKLQATIETSEGKLECELYDDKAPLTVANFVGLARGLRPFWDGKQSAWVKRPLYDGTTFHRLIPDFVIQGGDHMGDGTGDVGYQVIDEIGAGLKHDRAGLLCMANKGPNTNGGQFFITDAATPHLTAAKSYTIFGDCKPVDVVHKIARVPKAYPGGERPANPVEIRKVSIARR